MDTRFKKIRAWLENSSPLVPEIQRELTATRAMGPENGGKGELAKALLTESWLKKAGASFTRVDSPDERVECGFRPNIISRIQGKSARTLWLFGHLDVVGPGDSALWTGDPWTVRHDGDFVFGRGVEDNQQAVTSMLLLALACHELGLEPDLSLGLVFMADEECGSRHGLCKILEQIPENFSSEDLYIVPDGGSPDGTEIEIAEKGQLWLKFTVEGRQCHASTPEAGRNAFVAASALVTNLQTLAEIFPRQNGLFRPPVSTFAPTMHEANVPAVNIIPGREVFYMDCRLLPDAKPQDVKERVNEICAYTASRHGVAINMEVVQEQAASGTPGASPIVGILANAINSVYGVRPRTVGIGGATVAAMLRKRGLPAVVWSCLLNTCHQPDEKSSITATLRDAQVFGRIIFTPGSGNA